MSTNTEKAFDRVVWDYMFAICTHIGLGQKMRNWISSLYNDPRAQVKVNDTYSYPIIIKMEPDKDLPYHYYYLF